MTLYADTSFWLALWIPDDASNSRAQASAKRFRHDDWLWTELHQVEVPCAARSATHLQANPLQDHVARTVIWRCERAANRREFARRPLPLDASVHQVGVLSAAHGWEKRHTAFDVWHVAAAWALGADAFVTFDVRQAALAKAAGLTVVAP